jgi:hypothetical protein
MFKVRAVFLLTFAFLVCNVKSDSASGCCASWYGLEDRSCDDCPTDFTCRNNIKFEIGGVGLFVDTSRTDCISYTMSEADCSGTEVNYRSADDDFGVGCPANTSDSTDQSLPVTTSSSAITPTGLLGLLSASLVAFMLV